MVEAANVISFPSAASDDLPFHPLADLFPLIEGAEFDELVASIREDGQIDPIIVLNGSILDGRNRYRACKSAGIEPRLEEFGGPDPVRFVICKNVHRRHLNESQRALIAARLAPRKSGDNNRKDIAAEISAATLTEPQAAALLNVNKSTVSYAKRVLREGTDEEIAAIQEGKASVSTVARGIINNLDPETRKEQRIKTAEDARRRSAQTQQSKADLWHKLRDALDDLTALPLPADVVPVASLYDKRTGNGGVVNKRLRSAIEWLQEFEHAWNTRHGQ